jgi:cell division protein FtsN
LEGGENLMKKVIALVLSLVLMLAFTIGCKPAEQPKPEAPKPAEQAAPAPAPEKPAEAPAPAPEKAK